MFAYGLAQQVVIEGTTLEARCEIHGAIAEALAGLYPDRLDELVERLARHHLEAGQNDEAVAFLVRAARRFERESAIDDAIAALQRAADLRATIAALDRERLFAIYAEIAELCLRNRDLELGEQIMHKAIKAAESHRADRYVARFCVWRARMLVSSSRIEDPAY